MKLPAYVLRNRGLLHLKKQTISPTVNLLIVLRFATRKWQHIREKLKDIVSVSIDTLLKNCENKLNLRIDIYELRPQWNVYFPFIITRSMNLSGVRVSLHHHKGVYSVVTNMKMFTKTYGCKNCWRSFNKLRDLNRHQVFCVKELYHFNLNHGVKVNFYRGKKFQENYIPGKWTKEKKEFLGH